MPRYTLQFWYCWCKTKNEPAAEICVKCGASRHERHAQVHQSERAVIYRNPVTGERRTPARADQPMPEVYARQGFERMEIMNMTRYEKETGVIHEASNYSAGNETTAFREPEPAKAAPEVIAELARDVAAAAASGPWTERDNGPETFNLPVPLSASR